MIQIYSAGNENFTKNGEAVLMCYSCDLQAELNGTWVLTFSMPIDEEGRWKYVTENGILRVPTWQDDEQLYRISSVTKTDDMLTGTAYPIFYDSANDCVLMDCRPTNKTGQQALDIMCADSPYSGESNITAVKTAYFVRRNLLNAINGTEDPTFVSRWGGEILYDNYKVIINDHVGGDYGVEARYGRNVSGVNYVVDTTDVVTRIIPVAYNGHMMSGSSPWVDSSNISAYPKVFTREIRYENIRMAEDAANAPDDAIICNNQSELDAALTAAANADFATGIDTPKVTMSFDMVLIKNMASVYADDLLDSDGNQIQDSHGGDIESVWCRDYMSLEKVRLGDTIHCRDSKLDISSTARVISLTWDCINKTVTHVVLGDYQYNYVQQVTNALNRVRNIVADDGTVIAEQVKGFLDGSQTQLRTQYNLATRQDVVAILFENLDTTSPMYGALGIGTQGICISKTRTSDGRDWDWTTGITANGMNASMGVFGILSDKLGINWINLDTGEMSLGGSTTIGGKTVSEYLDDIEDEIAEYESDINQAIADIQHQVDGAIDSWYFDYEPTLNNYPANQWTTTALKEEHEGDLFYDKSTGNSYRFFNNNGTWAWTIITDTAAGEALALASEAKDTADGKRRTFVSQPVPPYDPGDLWMTGTEIKVCTTGKAESESYAAADWERRDNYASGQAFQDFLTQYEQDYDTLEGQIDGKIETFSQSADPSTNWTEEEKQKHIGDLWYNTNTGKTYTYSGTAWTELTATPPTNVINAIGAKATIFTSQPSPPYQQGDLWFNSASSDIMTCISSRSTGNYNSADWQKRNKYTDDSALKAYKLEMATLTNSMQEQIDGKIMTWRQASDPSVDWTGLGEDSLYDDAGELILDENSEDIITPYAEEKRQHTGDLWQNTTDNSEWRYTGDGWEPQEVPDALLDKIDGKRTIYGSQPTSPYAVNDLWCEGENGDIKICIQARVEGESFYASDWTFASKYTDDSSLNYFIEGAYKDTIEELKEQADGKAETWYQANDPSTAWTDSETKALHKGDLWYKTDDSTTWMYSGTAWQAMDIPADVFDTIDGKSSVYATQPTPPYELNDVYFTGSEIFVCTHARSTGSYTASDWARKEGYTDDTNLNLFLKGDYATFVSSTKDQLDRKIETWYQKNDPSTAWTQKETDVVLQDSSGENLLDSSGNEILTDRNVEKYEHTGDIWKDLNDNSEWVYTGDGWDPMDVPDEVYDQIDGKAAIYTGTTTPTGANERDLWFKGPDYPIYTYVNGSWVEYNKYTSDENLDDFVDNTFTPWKNDIDEDVETVLDKLDGQIIAAVINGNIINAINISTEGIKIQATKLNINGVVSINNGFVVNTNGTFEANAGTIGNIHVEENKLYSGSKSTAASPNNGFYLDKDGNFALGTNTAGLTWDGSALTIKASSLTIGGVTAATQTYVNGQRDEAAKTATDFMSWSSGDGLTISETLKNQADNLNVQIKATGICFRNNTNRLGLINGTQFTLYKPGSNNVMAMSLTADGLFFYKNDGSTVSAKYTNNGLEVLTGKIGDFAIANSCIAYGDLGENNSVYVSPSTPGHASIGGSDDISGWAFTTGTKFGVHKSGKVYASELLINGINVTGSGIYSNGKTAYNTNASGFCLDKNGNVGIGNATAHIYYWFANDAAHLDIKADSITIGGNTAATQVYAFSAATQKANEAAKTATNYLHYSDNDGLVINGNESSINTGKNVQLKSDGIRLRDGSKTRLGIFSDSITMYRSNGTSAAMNLTDSTLTFYDTGGNESAVIGASGLSVKAGRIGGFKVSSTNDTSHSAANGGHRFADSLYAQVINNGGYDYEIGIRGGSGNTAASLYACRVTTGTTWASGIETLTELRMDGTFVTKKANIGSWTVTGDRIQASNILLKSNGEIQLAGYVPPDGNVNHLTAWIDKDGYASFKDIVIDYITVGDMDLSDGDNPGNTDYSFFASKDGITIKKPITGLLKFASYAGHGNCYLTVDNSGNVNLRTISSEALGS